MPRAAGPDPHDLREDCLCNQEGIPAFLYLASIFPRTRLFHPVLADIFFTLLIDGSIQKNAVMMAAGPLMVMETEVEGSVRSKPE
jgi:hypothetical protein